MNHPSDTNKRQGAGSQVTGCRITGHWALDHRSLGSGSQVTGLAMLTTCTTHLSHGSARVLLRTELILCAGTK